MKLIIFGATGRTGRHLVDQALAQGHMVTAFVRNPAALTPRPGLAILRGDLLNPPDVEAAIRGHDVVLSALGADRTAKSHGRAAGPLYIRTIGTERILAAMEKVGTRRFICQSAYGAGENKNRNLYAIIAWQLAKAGFEDTDRQERLVRRSPLEWTLVRPARLTDEPKRGTYRTGVSLRVGPLARIGRADVADFMLKQVADPAYIRKSPALRY